MKTWQPKRILLTGYAADIRDLASLLASPSTHVMQLTEQATNAEVPRAVDIVVYAMSEDSGFSTQLHSLFVYVHDRVQKSEEYRLPIGEVDLARTSFPELSTVPAISTDDLKRKIARVEQDRPQG